MCGVTVHVVPGCVMYRCFQNYECVNEGLEINNTNNSNNLFLIAVVANIRRTCLLAYTNR